MRQRSGSEGSSSGVSEAEDGDVSMVPDSDGEQLEAAVAADILHDGPSSAAATKPVPVGEREWHVVEWTVYANTDVYVRDFDILQGHVSEGRDVLAANQRNTIINKLRATADTLSEALSGFPVDNNGDEDVDRDVGLDSFTQRATLQLHIDSHNKLADELEARSFDEWKRSMAAEPRVSRRTRTTTNGV